PNIHAFTVLEVGYRLPCLASYSPLAGDNCNFAGCRLKELLVGDGLAYTHADNYLLDAGNLHCAFVAKFLVQILANLAQILLLKPWYDRCLHSSSPDRTDTLTFWSLLNLYPARTGLPDLSTSATLEMWRAASTSIIPPRSSAF